MLASDVDRQALIRQIAYAARTKSLAAFIGSGLSTGLPGWDELVAFMYRALGLVELDSLQDNLADIAEWYANEIGDRSTLSTELAKLGAEPALDQTIIHRMLVRMGIRVFWTTNFDIYIETAIQKELGEDPLVVSSHRDLARIAPGRPVVFKLHGSVTGDLSKIVLGRDEFETSFLDRRLILDYLVYYLQTYHVLFLGLSFRDPDLDYVRLILRSMYGRVVTPRDHFFLMRQPSRGPREDDEHFTQRELRFRYWARQMAGYGFRHVPIADFTEVPEVVRSALRTVCTPLPYGFTARVLLNDSGRIGREIARVQLHSNDPIVFNVQDRLVRFDIGVWLVAPEPIDRLLLRGLKWRWTDAVWDQPIEAGRVEATYTDGRYAITYGAGAIFYDARITRTGRHQVWEPAHSLSAQDPLGAGVIGYAIKLGKVEEHTFAAACSDWQRRAGTAYLYPDYGRLWFPVPDRADGPVEKIVLKPGRDDRQDAARVWVDLLGNPDLELTFEVEARFVRQVVSFTIRWSKELDGFEIIGSEPAEALRYWLEHPAALDARRPFLPDDGA